MTEYQKYHDGFSKWEDVAYAFGDAYEWSPEEQKAKTLRDIPEPEEVYFAGYVNVSYDGDAIVSYRNGDKYYLVDGGHCSCYGLEGQWSPEEYDRETFLGMIDRKLNSYTENSEYVSHSHGVWKFIRNQVKGE